MKELRGIMKEKADAGDDLAKGVQDTFGEKPDNLLVRFIRARKYDVNRAFELMKGRTAAKDVHSLQIKPYCCFFYSFIHSLLLTIYGNHKHWHNATT